MTDHATFILTGRLFLPQYDYPCGPGTSVGIATGYGLDGPGFETRWWRDFPHLSRPALEPSQPPVQWVPDFPWGKKSGRDMSLTPHPLLVPWSWKSRAILLLPLWAVLPVHSLTACTRVTFTFSYDYPSTLSLKHSCIFPAFAWVEISSHGSSWAPAFERQYWESFVLPSCSGISCLPRIAVGTKIIISAGPEFT
jgi:hypothetical protein